MNAVDEPQQPQQEHDASTPLQHENPCEYAYQEEEDDNHEIDLPIIYTSTELPETEQNIEKLKHYNDDAILQCFWASVESFHDTEPRYATVENFFRFEFDNEPKKRKWTPDRMDLPSWVITCKKGRDDDGNEMMKDGVDHEATN